MRYLIILLKFAATAAIFVFFFLRYDLGAFVSRLDKESVILGLAAGAAGAAIQAAVAAVRLRLCLHMLGRDVSTAGAWIACQFGGLFSHTPFSFIGGDAARVWHMVRGRVPLGDATRAVVVDRYLGFLGMMFWVIVVSPAMFAAIKDPHMTAGYWLLLAVGVAASLGFLILGRFPLPAKRSGFWGHLTDLTSVSRYLISRPADALKALGLAIVMNALSPVMIWMIGLMYGSGISFITAMVAAPTVFLIAMIPISVAGWGLREGAFVVAFGLFGVPAESALVVSVTFGLSILLAYTPAVVLLFRRRAVSVPPA